MAILPNPVILSASHSDLDPIPIYNVWKQKAYIVRDAQGDSTARTDRDPVHQAVERELERLKAQGQTQVNR